jgi:tetratricopeptide (TPR) repeat protein
MNWLEHNDSFDEDDDFENMEEKVSYYQKIIRNHGKNRKDLPDADIIESLVDYCISVERFADALEFCNIWLVHNPVSADAYHKSAVVLSQLNKPNEALKNVNLAIEYDPFLKEALLTKALIFEQLGNVAQGISIIDSILSYDPGNEEVLFRKAMLLQSAFKTDEALEILQYLENVEYLPAEVFQEIAHCYHLLYDYNKSAQYYEKAIDLNPFDYLIWYNYGVMHGHKGSNYRAIDCYKMVLALKEDFVPALFNLGNSYAVTARLVEAIETYQQLLKVSPNDIETLHNLASTFADNKQYLSSIEYYTRVINIDPANHQAFFGRGYCYDSMDNFENALNDYNIALVFTPSSKNILQQKADLLYNFGKINESLECYLRALELEPNDEHSIYDVAYIYYELGDLNNAEDFALKLIDLSYSYSDAWFLLAKIQIVRKNDKKALKYLLESIKLDSSKYEEFVKDFEPLVNNFKKFKALVDKSLNPRKSIF